MPATTYFTCRLVVKPPFERAIVSALAKSHGFTAGTFEQDEGTWASAGDFMLVANESSQARLQARVSTLVNFLRSSGHAKNTGAFDIKPVST